MGVVEKFPPGGRDSALKSTIAPRKGKAKWLRRQALQIAAQLTDDEDDARAILRYALRLVTMITKP